MTELEHSVKHRLQEAYALKGDSHESNANVL